MIRRYSVSLACAILLVTGSSIAAHSSDSGNGLFGMGLYYVYAVATQDMAGTVEDGRGGAVQFNIMTGDRDNLLTRVGFTVAFDFSLLMFRPKTSYNSRYNLYDVSLSSTFDFSIFSAGFGFMTDFIDVKLHELNYSHVFNTIGFFLQGGVNIPLFTRHISFNAFVRYGWVLGQRDRLTDGSNREVYFSMNMLRFYGGATLRL